MRTLALAAGVLLATVATIASAQRYYDRPNYDPYWGSRASGEECWNPRAGHYEGVRPGEAQNDLDFSRCRAIGGRYGERRAYRERELRRDYYTHECWVPSENRWEVARPGEIQDSLDFNNCRPLTRNPYPG